MIPAYTYDIECLENFFSVVAIKKSTPIAYINEYIEADCRNDIEGMKIALAKINPVILWAHADHPECTKQILSIIDFFNQESTLIGFNNLRYDKIVASALIVYSSSTKSNSKLLSKVRYISDLIISGDNLYYDDKLRMLMFYSRNNYEIDLMYSAIESRYRTGLKQLLINLYWYNILDLPVGNKIELSRVDELLYYNINDTLGTNALSNHLTEKLRLRFNLNKLYKVDVTNKTKSGIADILLAKFYSEFSGTKYEDFKDLRTYRNKISLRDCVNPEITLGDIPITIITDLNKFKSTSKNKRKPSVLSITKPSTLNEFLNTIKNKTIVNTTEELKTSFILKGEIYTIGTGGLHSNDVAALHKADDDHFLYDIDATSFYPFIVENNDISPAHLDKKAFVSSSRKVRMNRTDAKSKLAYPELYTKEELTELETIVDGMKVVANSGGFGKMGYENHWAYDRKAMVKVTLNGQFSIISLIEDYITSGFKILSVNTDGILVKVHKDKVNLFHEIKSKWENKYKYNLELSEYTLYVRLNVNNYLAVYKNGKLKKKGMFNDEINIDKGFNMPIISKALIEYYVNGNTKIPEFVRSWVHKGVHNIYDYCLSQKIGAEFQNVLISLDGKYKVLQKHLRFYVSTEGDILAKKNRYTGSITKYTSGFKNRVFNKFYYVDNPSEYSVNFEFYISKIRNIIHTIEKDTLFN